MQLLLGIFVIQFCGFKSLDFFSFFHIATSVKSTPKNDFPPDFFNFSFRLQLVKIHPEEKKTLNLLYVLASYCQVVTFALGFLGS
jgi:hypothetical protein